MSRYILGIDPSPTGGHGALTLWSCGELLRVEASFTFDTAWSTIAIEDPRGVLFQRTSSLLWSQTCVEAGRFIGRYSIPDENIVKPAVAREFLASLANEQKSPRKDGEVKAMLEVVYGPGAFDREKACGKRKNKSHGSDCQICGGTGIERAAGILSPLNTPHLRDAFVIAQFVALRGEG